jgi:hypothetical protein
VLPRGEDAPRDGIRPLEARLLGAANTELQSSPARFGAMSLSIGISRTRHSCPWHFFSRAD